MGISEFDKRFDGTLSKGLVEDGVNDCYGELEMPTGFDGNLELPTYFGENMDSLAEFDELDHVLNYELMEKDGVIGDWDGCEWKGPEPSSLDDFMPIDKTPDAKQLVNYVQDDSGSHIFNIADNFQESSYVFHPTSPVSELESSGSCSAAKIISIKTNIAGPRSKRARPSTCVTKWSAIGPLPLPASKKASNHRKNKNANKNLPQPSLSVKDELLGDPAGMKKCTHCQITKTPQWREGPNGPKTLCNACGVRYRSGRLFPEYRPAASPTFVPQLHSNSHKKVIEMRSKGKRCFTQIEEPFVCPELEYHPLSSYTLEF